MSEIVVIGAGLVGHVASRLLARKEFTVVAVDRDPERLKLLDGFEGLRTVEADATDPRTMESLAENAKVFILALPGNLGRIGLEAAVSTGTPVVDISFSPEDSRELDTLAKELQVPVVVDCGVAPGISNMCVGYAASQLATTEDVLILAGGIPSVRRLPFEYVAAFSPGDVIEEYTRDARMRLGGSLMARPALSDVELVHFDEIGTLEAFDTDGLRTLLETIDAPNMREKTLRYPGHAALMRTLRDAGFFDKAPISVGRGDDAISVSPHDVTLALFEKDTRLGPKETELVVLRVEVSGTGADGMRVMHRFDLLERTSYGVTAMARTTAAPCALVAARIARGEWPAGQAGVIPPEVLAAQPGVFDEIRRGLEHHAIVLSYSMKPLPE
jgi:lysine 6-dehydrogenase